MAYTKQEILAELERRKGKESGEKRTISAPASIGVGLIKGASSLFPETVAGVFGTDKESLQRAISKTQELPLGQIAGDVKRESSRIGLGLAQIFPETSSELLGATPEALQNAIQEKELGYRKEAEERGAWGIPGQILANPTSYIPGVGFIMNAVAGGASGALRPTVGNESRLENAASEALISGAAGKALQYGGRILGYGADKIRPKDDRAYIAIAKRLRDSGIDSTQVSGIIKKMKESDVAPTMSEVTESSGLFTLEKNLLQSPGKSSDAFGKRLSERAKGTLPTAIRKKAERLAVPRDVLDAAYGAAEQEAKDSGNWDSLVRFAEESKGIKQNLDSAIDEYSSLQELARNLKSTIDEKAALAKEQRGMWRRKTVTEIANEAKNLNSVKKQIRGQEKVISTLEEKLKTIPLDKGIADFSAIGDSINRRLSELGGVNNVERSALIKAREIIDNASQRGNDFRSVLDAKKQLDDIYIENADANAQKAAQRHVARYTKEIDSTLLKASPTYYAAAKKLAKRNMASRELMDSLGATRESAGLAAIYNKLPTTRDDMADFMRKLPDDATRAEFKTFFDDLAKVKRGFGGSDTFLNTGEGAKINAEMGAPVDPKLLHPSNFINRMGEHVDEWFRAKNKAATAKALLNPNESKLTDALARMEIQGLQETPIRGVVERLGARTVAAEREKDTQQNFIPEQAPSTQGYSREDILRELERRKQQPLPPQSSLAPQSMIQQNEGFRSGVYMDTEGNPTVGYGLNLKSGIAGKVWRQAGLPPQLLRDVRSGRAQISHEQGMALYRIVESIAINDAKAYYGDGFDGLTKPQQAALVDMSYQMGANRIGKFHTLRKCLKNKDANGIINSIKRSKYFEQTPERARRTAELLIQFNGVNQFSKAGDQNGL